MSKKFYNCNDQLVELRLVKKILIEKILVVWHPYHLNDKIKKEFVAIQQKIFDAQIKIHNYKTKKKLAKKQLEDKENIEQELQSLQDINNNNNNTITTMTKPIITITHIIIYDNDNNDKTNIILSQ